MAADDFVGVPRDDWRDLSDHVSRLGNVVFILLMLVALLVITLVQKGVLTSALDLFRAVVPGD